VLAKDRVPFAAVEKLVVQTDATATTARAILRDMGMELQVDVNPGWYYP
jgi:ssDNA thymidine ADP-ribosyltransferase, DarT